MKTLRRWLRIVRGAYRHFCKDTCPHCNSDARRPCPVCHAAPNRDWRWVRFCHLVRLGD